MSDSGAFDPNLYAEKLAHLSVALAQQAHRHAATVRNAYSGDGNSDPNEVAKTLSVNEDNDNFVYKNVNLPKQSAEEAQRYADDGSTDPSSRLSLEMQQLQDALKEVEKYHKMQQTESSPKEQNSSGSQSEEIKELQEAIPEESQTAEAVSPNEEEKALESALEDVKQVQEQQGNDQDNSTENSESSLQDALKSIDVPKTEETVVQTGDGAQHDDTTIEEADPVQTQQDDANDQTQQDDAGDQTQQDDANDQTQQDDAGDQTQQDDAGNNQTQLSSEESEDSKKKLETQNKSQLIIKGAKFGKLAPKKEDARTHDVIIAKHVDSKRDEEAGVEVSKYNLNYIFSDPDDRDHKFAGIFGNIDAKYLPSSTDLRDSWGDILDQLDLGSCVSNSVSYCVRYCYNRQKLGKFTPSRLYIYYNGR